MSENADDRSDYIVSSCFNLHSWSDSTRSMANKRKHLTLSEKITILDFNATNWRIISALGELKLLNL